MLHELHIEDLGVISSLDLVVGEGLTVVTGETGAGKTMLVEAISLLVGGRADPVVVRSGATEARIEGRFVIDDDEIVLARVIPVSGRSRAYVNGRLATVATLAEHGARLVDIHGQHAHQSLLSTGTQRNALDRFAGVDHEPLRTARARLTEIDAALAALGGDGRTRAREIDLLTFQIDELVSAELVDQNEERTLDALEDSLAGAVAHRERAEVALASLQGEGGAIDGVVAAASALHGRGPFTELVTRLRSIEAELADVGGELRVATESIDEDPQRLASVRERRQALRNLCRKYGETLADVMAFQTATQARLDELHGYEQRVERLEIDRVTALAAERLAAAEVGRCRRHAAQALGDAVQDHVRRLGMVRAEVTVEVGAIDPGDDVEFLLAANPGAQPLPLTKVASGGELARTMLAVRLVLTEAPDTLVFDEVDAGIGGAAATAVGRALAELGGMHQVLVVTHLAQVAALADAQVSVDKQVRGAATFATAVTLNHAARVAEIARMLSGEPDSLTARQHAAELLGEPGARARDGSGSTTGHGGAGRPRRQR